MRVTEARLGVRMLKFMDVFWPLVGGRTDPVGCGRVAECRRPDVSIGAGAKRTGPLDRPVGRAAGRWVPVDRFEVVEHV